MPKKKEISKQSEDFIEALPVEEQESPSVPAIVMPVYDPANRQDYINKMADMILTREATAYDIGRGLQLTDKQIDFCKYFAAGETMGNGSQSAIKAYGLDPSDRMQMQSARNYACVLKKPQHPANTLIQILINGDGYNEHTVDQNLNFIANQKADLKAAVLANREINTVLGRNNKKVIEVQVKHTFDTSNLDKKELKKFIEIARKCIVNDSKSE